MVPEFVCHDALRSRKRLLSLVVVLVQASCRIPGAVAVTRTDYCSKLAFLTLEHRKVDSLPQTPPASKRKSGTNLQKKQCHWILQESTQTDSTVAATDSPSSTFDQHTSRGQGLYRPFAEHAWNKLQSLQSSNVVSVDPIPEDLHYNTAPAKGFPMGSTVDMETRAMTSSSSSSSLFRYARFALLETNIVAASSPTTISNSTTTSDHNHRTTLQEAPTPASPSSPIGIQVLNFVIIPHQSHLPVWGADLVSLPGDRHLMLLDAQPVQPCSRAYESHWNEWHSHHVAVAASSSSSAPPVFPWGGDMPGEAAQYVSGKALWTRLQGSDQVRSIVQGELWDAFCEHLDLYLQLLEQEKEKHEQQQEDLQNNNDHESSNPFASYLQYRLANDPARPMLRALYGPEWTERVLHEVLFPQL